MTKALRRCGVSASHEKHFSLKNHGPVPPGHAEVSWLAAPHTPLPIRTVHLVRDPLKVIASRAAWGSFEKRDVRRRYDPTRKGRYALKYVPQIAEARTPIERAAVFWVAWTGLVEADEVLKVEDATPQVVFELAVYVNPDAQQSEPPPPTVNSNKHTTPEELTWGDVAHIPGVMLRAEQLGYL